MFPKSVIVLKNKEGGVLPENIHHLKLKYTGDCPICLQFQTTPVSSYCEHVFCKECIYESLEFSLKCPVCKKEISRLFDVILHIQEDIKEFVCLKLLSTLEMDVKQVDEYLESPYQKIYYLEDSKEDNTLSKSYCSSLFKIKTNPLFFYQSVDGQPYFLDNKILSRLILREGVRNLPLLLYGKVEEIKEETVGKRKHLQHLQEDTKIYIVKIRV